MKLVLKTLEVILIGYIIICILLYFFQEKLIFFPEKLPKTYKFNFDQKFKEINVTTKDQKILNGLLFKSENSKGLIFYLHVNAGSLNSWGQLLEKDGKIKRCTYFPEWRVQRSVFLRDKGCCAVCLKDLSGLLKTVYHDAIDHIVPLNLGGTNDITNFQLICQDCNLKKLGHTIVTSEYYPK